MKKLAKILLLGVMVCAAALPSFATDVSFTVFSDEEMNYYYYDMNSFDSGVTRYHDGDGFILTRINKKRYSKTLGITVILRKTLYTTLRTFSVLPAGE